MWNALEKCETAVEYKVKEAYSSKKISSFGSSSVSPFLYFRARRFPWAKKVLMATMQLSNLDLTTGPRQGIPGVMCTAEEIVETVIERVVG